MHRFRPVRMVVDRARQQGLTHTSISRLLEPWPAVYSHHNHSHRAHAWLPPTDKPFETQRRGGRRFPPLIPTIVTMSVTITITIITKRRAEWSFTLPCREPSPLRPVSGSSDAISGTV